MSIEPNYKQIGLWGTHVRPAPFKGMASGLWFTCPFCVFHYNGDIDHVKEACPGRGKDMFKKEII